MKLKTRFYCCISGKHTQRWTGVKNYGRGGVPVDSWRCDDCGARSRPWWVRQGYRGLRWSGAFAAIAAAVLLA